MALLGAPRTQRLLRYCAGPIYAGERLEWAKPGERLIYHLPKPRPDGQTTLSFTPLEWLDRVAVLIPPPRRHRHRYHGVLAQGWDEQLECMLKYMRIPSTTGTRDPERSRFFHKL
ncbi:MAG: transposase [Chromatiales bacterium]